MYCQIIIDINFAQTCQTLGRTRTSSPARPRTFCSTRGMCPSKISCWAWNPGDQNLNTRDRYHIYVCTLARVWINIGADSLHFVWFHQLCDTFTIVCWPLSMGKASISSSSLPMFWHCSDRQLGRYLGSSRLSVKLQFVAVAGWWLDMFITYHNTCSTFNTTVYENSVLAIHSWPPRTACAPTCMASRGLVQASGTVRPQRCTASVGGDPGSISTCCAWMLRFIEKAEFHKFQFIECVFYTRYFRVIGYSCCKAFRNMRHENLLPRPGMDQGKSWPEVLRFEWFCGHDTAPGTKTIDLGATWGCCFQSNARHVQKWQAGLPESNLCKDNISFGIPEQNCRHPSPSFRRSFQDPDSESSPLCLIYFRTGAGHIMVWS